MLTALPIRRQFVPQTRDIVSLGSPRGNHRMTTTAIANTSQASAPFAAPYATLFGSYLILQPETPTIYRQRVTVAVDCKGDIAIKAASIHRFNGHSDAIYLNREAAEKLLLALD